MSNVVRNVLESRARGLARADKEEYLNGMNADALTPVELLAALKERYDPGMDLEQMIQWYKDELEKADL